MKFLCGAVCAIMLCVGSAHAQFAGVRTATFRNPGTERAQSRLFRTPAIAKFRTSNFRVKPVKTPTIKASLRDRMSQRVLKPRSRDPHVVLTIGSGTSEGRSLTEQKQRVRSVTRNSPRLTPERPLGGRRLANSVPANDPGQLNRRVRQVETVTVIPGKNTDVATVSSRRRAAYNEVWTTKGDGAK